MNTFKLDTIILTGYTAINNIMMINDFFGNTKINSTTDKVALYLMKEQHKYVIELIDANIDEP